MYLSELSVVKLMNFMSIIVLEKLMATEKIPGTLVYEIKYILAWISV